MKFGQIYANCSLIIRPENLPYAKKIYVQYSTGNVSYGTVRYVSVPYRATATLLHRDADNPGLNFQNPRFPRVSRKPEVTQVKT